MFLCAVQTIAEVPKRQESNMQKIYPIFCVVLFYQALIVCSKNQTGENNSIHLNLTMATTFYLVIMHTTMT